MIDRETLYLGLPRLLQNVATSVEGWRLERFRFGRDFDDALQVAITRHRLSSEQLIRYRNERLAGFIRHAYESVPFYRSRFDAQGLHPNDIAGLEDLKALPILTKPEVQEAGNALMSQAVATKDQHTAHTSGTTGGGLRFATTKSAIREQWAVWWRFRRLHGLRRGTWCGYFGGRSVVPIRTTSPPFWRYDVPGRRILFSGYHMGPRTLDHYIDELRRRRPPWLHGYPSLLSLLAGHIVDSSSDLGYRPRWVTVGAENLLTHQANSMRAAFGTEPVQHYGMAEAVANASECSSGRLHCDEDFAAMEFVQDGKDRHRVVGTNLSNPATPLIRYDTGDLASPASDGCDCGLPGRIVSRVDGRLEDYVVLPSGARIGRLDHVFKDLVSIREAQIVQSRPGAVTIRVVPGPNYDEREERALLAEARKRMGSDMEIEIQHTELLERTEHGKLRLVVSHLHEPGVERE